MPIFKLLNFLKITKKLDHDEFSYISKNGIKKIFSKLGYKNILTDSDLEYDIFCLSSRMGLKGLNKIIVDYLISPIFGLIAHLFRKKDSDIFIFKKG